MYQRKPPSAAFGRNSHRSTATGGGPVAVLLVRADLRSDLPQTAWHVAGGGDGHRVAGVAVRGFNPAGNSPPDAVDPAIGSDTTPPATTPPRSPAGRRRGPEPTST